MSPCNEIVILKANNLTRQIISNGKTLRTVENINFSFNKGRVYNLVGPSGAGKTSFLRLLNRLDEPTEGEILFYDQSLISYKPTELRKKIAMLFQIPYMFEGTVRRNIEYCCPIGESDDINNILNRVGLTADYTEKDTENLSVGEKQRIALARALVQKPEVLLLDEPTSSLDPSASKKIEELILALSRELCLTIIIVTHHPDQALRLGGETLLLVKGRLIESGNTDRVLISPQSEDGQKYISNELS